MLRDARDQARVAGDIALVNAMTADLERMGIRDEPSAELADMETAVPEPLERAVPRRKGGRPRLPRCEHGRVAERCAECSDAAG